jgi:hypothetical protein
MSPEETAYIADNNGDGAGVTCPVCGLNYETLIGWKVWCLRLHARDAQADADGSATEERGLRLPPRLEKLFCAKCESCGSGGDVLVVLIPFLRYEPGQPLERGERFATLCRSCCDKRKADSQTKEEG